MTQELEIVGDQVRVVYDSFYLVADVVKRLLEAGIAFSIMTESTEDATEWTLATTRTSLPIIHSYKE